MVNSTMLTTASNNLDQPILSDTAFSHQAKNQCILGSDSNSQSFSNNELESRIYEEVHLNEGKGLNLYLSIVSYHIKIFLR